MALILCFKALTNTQHSCRKHTEEELTFLSVGIFSAKNLNLSLYLRKISKSQLFSMQLFPPTTQETEAWESFEASLRCLWAIEEGDRISQMEKVVNHSLQS